MILAIGNRSDKEFEAYKLIEKIALDKGVKIVHFGQDRCLLGDSIFFEVKNGLCKYFIKVDGEVYDVDDFGSVLYFHPHPDKEILNYKPYEHANFITHQFLEMRKGLWTYLKNKKWVNDPWLMQIAEGKAYQLQVASDVGFTIPNTVMTSDPEIVSELYTNSEGKIISKIITPTPILDHVIYTNRVTSEDMESIDSVRMCPSIFQTEIEKSYELRIIVVGQNIFAAKIFSQGNKETEVDWRKNPKHNDYSVKMESCSIPNGIKKKIHSFMKIIGLNYGAIDMVVTPDNEYVFLEINPAGQWYFVQTNTAMDIASAIVDLVV